MLSACELHGKFDGGAGRAECQLRGGEEGAAEGDGHPNRSREQGQHAAGQKGAVHTYVTVVPYKLPCRTMSCHVMLCRVMSCLASMASLVGGILVDVGVDVDVSSTSQSFIAERCFVSCGFSLTIILYCSKMMPGIGAFALTTLR